MRYVKLYTTTKHACKNKFFRFPIDPYQIRKRLIGNRKYYRIDALQIGKV